MSEPQRIKEAVKEAYASLATERNAATDSGTCQPPAPLMDKLLRYGYSPEELAMANDTQMPTCTLPSKAFQKVTPTQCLTLSPLS
ncbi:MAG: hypothetical protein JRN62_08190 [Nitrososphaerota archaeon]|jgi:hypothetical protein|nr:hypothetical protein [Nitrososphaerota archaeon]